MPSYTKATAILILFASYHLAIAAPAPAPGPIPDTTNELYNAYSGVGGNASGGSVKSSTPGNTAGPNILGPNLLKLFSGNAGNGGHALSGSASAPSNLDISGTTTNTNADGTTVPGNVANTLGNAYSGAGGKAQGGDVTDSVGGLVELFSDNAGSGGNANSGPAENGRVLQSMNLSGVGRTRVSRVIRVYLD